MEITNKAKITDLANNAGSVLSAFGKILGVFKPTLGAPVAMAGAVLTDLIKVDDEVSKDKIIGITSTSLILDNLIADLEDGKPIDINQLRVLNSNLKLLDSALDKFYKIIS
ncbi:hypothetical protein A9K75_08945 [Campylobacter fetus subsp. testudinum]|uniref:hypothetical protein n=1 Tax=Campylobacter fetus TaxID=196 RepID=UPI000818B734|nr:hypothetical protein [Campylobacter fetus]OCR98997.1 hypothetical protein A9K75_08945 [Campylobacter fetus subsp. testudinum]